MIITFTIYDDQDHNKARTTDLNSQIRIKHTDGTFVWWYDYNDSYTNLCQDTELTSSIIESTLKLHSIIGNGDLSY